MGTIMMNVGASGLYALLGLKNGRRFRRRPASLGELQGNLMRGSVRPVPFEGTLYLVYCTSILVHDTFQLGNQGHCFELSRD